jgi:Mg/Co/Ni transporter MgtE
MAAVHRVYAARLAGMVVLGPDGESIGRVRDVVISISIVRQQPRVLGLVVELLTRRRIFVPILRITSIEPGAVTLATGSVSLRRFAQRPGEVLVLGQVVETRVRVDDPDLPQLSGVDVIVVDLGIEQTRTRDWMVTKVAVRPQRRLARRSNVHVVDWQLVHGLTPSGLAMPDQGVAQLLEQFEGQRPVEVAEAILELPDKRRYEVVSALDDERMADVLQELPEDEQADMLKQLPAERAADVLEAMDPDDAADLLGSMSPSDAEQFLRRMDPEDSEDVRRLLSHSPDTAGGLMTSEPVVLAPDTTVAEALARVRDPDLTPALASLVFVTRPPTATPTGHYLGCVHLQRLLREPPADLVSGIVDTDLPNLAPEDSLAAVTRYFAAYNLVCGPVVDDENHLLGAVSVDDVLDHLLPEDWRERVEEPQLPATEGAK